MTVYVVTRGDYSSYEICGVTLDKNRAEKMVKLYADHNGDARIEEYETDAEDSDVLDNLVPVYYVHIGRTGEVMINICEYTDGRKPYKPFFKLYNYFYYYSKDQTPKEYFVAILTAKDKEHALKIAFDERAKQMAEKYGAV